ncbi:MAG: cob(I)yrinic acid a,c-diamide adenosyltransferase [Alphaproteobacteria bacterium]|nr:cob(I)yrinic acid a,c-diamide adenosyltransferase [Alphaproteobacteria bacterium]
MVKLNKLYTRTGDNGYTSLINGERRIKNNPRISAIGVVDEANASIGLARSYLAIRSPKADTDEVNEHVSNEQINDIERMLARIQNDLFDLGADLAMPVSDTTKTSPPSLRISQVQVDWLEQQIDRFNKTLQPLHSFILPGGTLEAAALHLARTIVRRAERAIIRVTKEENETIKTETQSYINRLSDLLFVASRILNQNGNQDLLWVPGAHHYLTNRQYQDTA